VLGCYVHLGEQVAVEGLKSAAAKVLKATWQRCRVHFLRNALAHAGKGQRQMVLALINTVFAQESQEAAISQLRAVADQLRTKSLSLPRSWMVRKPTCPPS
jgi:putative transposase